MRRMGAINGSSEKYLKVENMHNYDEEYIFMMKTTLLSNA